MEAGRELDAKVAEALGWMERIGGWIKFTDNGPRFIEDKHFRPSTTWSGIGVLVEEAEKQGIYLNFEHFREGRYLGRAYKFCEASQEWVRVPSGIDGKPPIAGTVSHAVSLAFLKVKGIAI